jgi:PAS domain S-box-containing protein
MNPENTLGLTDARTTMAGTVLDALPMAVAVIDPAGVIVFVNRAWREFAVANGLGTPGFGVGSNYVEVCAQAPDDVGAAAAYAGVTAVLAGTQPAFELDYPCHAPHVRRWFHMTVLPLRRRARDGAIVLHQDVSCERMMEAQLRERDTRRERFFQLSRDLFCIGRFDGHFTPLNRAWDELLGGDGDPDRYSVIALSHPDDRAGVETELGRMVATRSVIGFQSRLRCHDGSYRWLEWNAQAPPGHPDIYAVARDVTERRRAEQAMRDWQERYELAIESTDQILYDWDPVGNLVRVAGAYEKVLGYPPGDHARSFEDWLAIVHRDDRRRLARTIEQALATKRGFGLEFRAATTSSSATKGASSSTTPAASRASSGSSPTSPTASRPRKSAIGSSPCPATCSASPRSTAA